MALLRAMKNTVDFKNKKVWIGAGAVAAAVAIAVAIYKSASGSSNGSSGSGGSGPNPPGPPAVNVQWVPVQSSGGNFSLAPGTYRATAQTSGNVNVTNDEVVSGLEGQGLQNVTVHMPGEPFPSDWPDQRQGPNMWRVEATVGKTTAVPVQTTKSFLFWSGTITVLSMFSEERASGTPKATWTVIQNNQSTYVDMSPNDLLEVRMPPGTGPDSWYVYESGTPTASVYDQYQDPQTLEWVIVLRMLGPGAGTIIGQMQAHAANTSPPTMDNPPADYQWTLYANVAYPAGA